MLSSLQARYENSGKKRNQLFIESQYGVNCFLMERSFTVDAAHSLKLDALQTLDPTLSIQLLITAHLRQ